MSVLANYLRGAGALTAQAVVQRLLGALTSIVLARGLGTTGFGAYSAVINTASSAYGMVRFGVDAAIHVYVARGKRDLESGQRTAELLGAGLGILAVAGFVAAVATAVSAEWLAVAVFGEPDLAGPLVFAGLLTALQCLTQFSYAALAGFQKFGVYARVMILNAALILALSSGGMWFYGLAGALSGYCFAQAILAVSLGHAATRAMRDLGIRIVYSRFAHAVVSLMKLGFPFYLSGLVSVPVIFYLQGLLSRSAGVDALGMLRVIGTITAVIAFIPTSVAAATTSTLTRVHADKGASDSTVFDYAFLHLKIVWYFTTIMAIALVMLTPALVDVLFGKEYAAAIEPGTVALFSMALSSTAGAAGSLFFAVERSGMLFWQSVLQTIVLLIGGLLVIPSMGLLGYLSAELAGNLVGMAFVLVMTTQMSGRNLHARGLAISGLLTMAATFSAITISFFVTDSVLWMVGLLLTVTTMIAGAIFFGTTQWELSVVQRTLTVRRTDYQ